MKTLFYHRKRYDTRFDHKFHISLTSSLVGFMVDNSYCFSRTLFLVTSKMTESLRKQERLKQSCKDMFRAYFESTVCFGQYSNLIIPQHRSLDVSYSWPIGYT